MLGGRAAAIHAHGERATASIAAGSRPAADARPSIKCPAPRRPPLSPAPRRWPPCVSVFRVRSPLAARRSPPPPPPPPPPPSERTCRGSDAITNDATAADGRRAAGPSGRDSEAPRGPPCGGAFPASGRTLGPKLTHGRERAADARRARVAFMLRRCPWPVWLRRPLRRRLIRRAAPPQPPFHRSPAPPAGGRQSEAPGRLQAARGRQPPSGRRGRCRGFGALDDAEGRGAMDQGGGSLRPWPLPPPLLGPLAARAGLSGMRLADRLGQRNATQRNAAATRRSP
ncbi:hypothetical protein CXG81DRAFT_17091 [Caulochytrium protostelioides]|uniref:Uncharacterized protein n=1 Tax=Caulochytrium protostelioides TaxID=1555241 RepID=A0A4P9XCZ8_9FUNG|nr:hypothetical protein CXG81DRAFT_17091 [Caulochytrium protostelioides]|eukprot:RKP03346.1 hypothetical protein CXG81DRAFT_17091 [Caulochytrium protostelioides]